MARIDSILAVVVQQGANELRVGTGREPKMLAFGTPKRFHMVSTSEQELRELLGEIFTDERAEMLRTSRRFDLSYDAGELGTFRVTFTARQDGGFDAVFLRDRSRGAASRGSSASHVSSAINQANQASAASAASAANASSTSSTSAERTSLPEAPARLSVVRPTEPAAPSAPHEQLVARALAMRASDLHLVDGDVPVVRVDGQLHRLDDEGPVEDVALALGLDASVAASISAGRALDFGLSTSDGARARVNVYRTSEGIAAALRFLPRSVPALTTLGFPLPIDDLVEFPHGLVLLCGATGSGKSTTLAALAQTALTRRSIVLLSLEDPIEYTLVPGARALVRQREIGRDVHDFPSALRDALREDPDVLVLGEMRDPETISLALTAAETGHLVLTTLHCGSTASAVQRIVDAYPAERQEQIRSQLADVLRG
ncbi:MAG TPA: ATPase, T2SS/T4P/T4SS family, partial [Polyangiaceae bacterium]|nr:ATPase, T2SS/T4P/T4SS family [Polyangiaceae bacterium]